MSKLNALKNISWLWTASLIGSGCAFLTQVTLARMLGPGGYGLFAATLAFMGIMVPLVGFGIPQFWLKEFGEKGWSAFYVINGSFKAIGLSFVVVAVVVLLWVSMYKNGLDGNELTLLMIAFIAGQVSIEMVSAKLQLEDSYLKLAIWQMTPHVLRMAAIFAIGFLCGDYFDVRVAAGVYALVGLGTMAVAYGHVKKIFEKSIDLKGHGVNKNQSNIADMNMMGVMADSWPFGLAALSHLIYFQSNIVLLEYLKGSEAVGEYNVAFTVVVAILIFPGIVYQKFLLPKMHRWAHQDRKLFFDIYNKGNWIMLGIGVLAMVFVIILSPIIVSMLFGQRYMGSVDVLKILACSVPIVFVASSVGATLVTQEHMRLKVRLMMFVAVINVVLNLLLIPKAGVNGAAVATVISNLFLMILYFWGAKRYVFPSKFD